MEILAGRPSNTLKRMLNSDELPLAERKGLIGMAYLRVIAALAGYSFAVPESDYDSIDAKLSSRSPGKRGLDFQVKCTSIDLGNASDFAFDLSIKNYDDLRADSILPRYLLVVVTPESIDHWVRQNERRMQLRRCGYWHSLRGAPATTNASTVSIHIQRANVLTPSVLQSLMVQGGPA